MLSAASAHAITTANGSDAGGTTTTINNGPGDQTEPRMSGDLAVYTDKNLVEGSRTHYFDFPTGLDCVVPAGASWDSDNLSDAGEGRIVFSRTGVSDGKTSTPRLQELYRADGATVSRCARPVGVSKRQRG